MRFTLVSISKKVLDVPAIESAIIPTKDGVITVLPFHSALISALSPGVLSVKYDGKTENFAIGGGVLETDGTHLNILADMVEEGHALNLEDIQKKKEEAKKLLEEYRSSKETVDMDTLLEIEEQYLKESAKEMLATRGE